MEVRVQSKNVIRERGRVLGQPPFSWHDQAVGWDAVTRRTNLPVPILLNSPFCLLLTCWGSGALEL